MNRPIEAYDRLLVASHDFMTTPTDTTREAYRRALALVESLEQLPGASYRRLFGVEQTATDLQQDILTEQHHIHYISGSSGIGKTSLADFVVRHKVVNDPRHPTHIHWIRPRLRDVSLWSNGQAGSSNSQALLNDFYIQLGLRLGIDKIASLSRDDQIVKLAEEMAKESRLIVVDNAPIAELSEVLPTLAEDTQFLVVAPQVTTAVVQKNGASFHQMTSLDEADSVDLVRYESDQQSETAWVRGIPVRDLVPIYEKTHGYPLALKLVVGQMVGTGNLDSVLNRIEAFPQTDQDALYNDLHTQSWRLLSEPERMVMYTLSLVGPSGASHAMLQDLSDLSDSDLEIAVHGLAQKRLITVDDTRLMPVYTIHQLTYRFVKDERSAA